MKALIILTILSFLSSSALAQIAACTANGLNFYNGSQHSDCDYISPALYPAYDNTSTQYQTDLYWLNMVHTYATTNMAKYPFGAALVNHFTNELVSIGFNNYFTGDPVYSSIVVSHAETVVITNVTRTGPYADQLTFNSTTNLWSHKSSGIWANLTLYGNVEACPMCAQAAIWRGLRSMVFGARAKALQTQRCWTQPTLTAFEVVDHSASFATFMEVRGPYPEVENTIVQGFRNQCPTPAPTPTPSAAPTTGTPGTPAPSTTSQGTTSQPVSTTTSGAASLAASLALVVLAVCYLL